MLAFIAGLVEADEERRSVDAELQSLLKFIAWNDLAFSFDQAASQRESPFQRLVVTLRLVECLLPAGPTPAHALPYALLLAEGAVGDAPEFGRAASERLFVQLIAAGRSRSVELARSRLECFAWLSEASRATAIARLPRLEEAEDF